MPFACTLVTDALQCVPARKHPFAFPSCTAHHPRNGRTAVRPCARRYSSPLLNHRGPPAYQPHPHHNRCRTPYLKPTDIARVISLNNRCKQQRKQPGKHRLQINIGTGYRGRQPMNCQNIEGVLCVRVLSFYLSGLLTGVSRLGRD